MNLKDFQEKYVGELVTRIKQGLRAEEVNPHLPLQHIIFKSPTGSGKTTMLSATLKNLADDFFLSDKSLVFLWLAPQKLHTQSYKKLKAELEDTEYNLINIDDGLPNGELAKNTVLFSNWESLNNTYKKDNEEKGIHKGDWKNKATRQGEDGHNLTDILNETRNASTKVVLIVDESHHGFYSDQSQKFIDEVVKPVLVVEASATPKNEPSIEVPHKEVVDSGLIKKQIIINNNLENATKGKAQQDILEKLVDLSLQKRSEIKRLYQENNKDINPLILIQLPNDSEKMDELDYKDREKIEEILSSKSITYDNRKLGIWLSGNEKVNLENIEDLDNKVEVLLFKQAIALGWDCPRAQILVMLRDIKSDAFKVQTAGRVLRMPEAEHYLDDRLNAAYVYSDIESIRIETDTDTDTSLVNLIKYQHSKIREEFANSNISLPDSVYLSRVDYGDLRKDFRVFLEACFNDYFDISSIEDTKKRYNAIAEKLQLEDSVLIKPVVADEIVEALDDLTDREALRTVDFPMSDTNVDRIFNIILKESIHPFTGFARTRSIVYPTLKDLFASADIDELTMKKAFACSKSNQEKLKKIFSNAIDSYQSTYQRELKKRRDRSEIIYDWSVPQEDIFSDNYHEIKTSKNIYEHYYRKVDASDAERAFEDRYLEPCQNILWWYKNGEKMKDYFAVPYYEMMDDSRTKRKGFYPDYIVRFNDGTIGIFELKTDADTSPDYKSNKHNPEKANTIQKWFRQHADLGIWGGIINTRYKSSEFWLQADAITHEMALDVLSGKEVIFPEVEYNYEKWKEFSLK